MQLRNGATLTSLAQLSKMTPGSAMAAAIEEATGAVTKEIGIAKIVVKPQDRFDFSDIKAFAERLKIVGGVHTAIIVRLLDDEHYELAAGERRVRGSTLNGWETIPAKVFPKDTPDYVIRMYQVSENVDRKPLSATETAMGLANDIERFGREEAAKLWTNPNGKQRSESWISKHLRFRKYGPISRALFDAALFDDIEAANKMDDIETHSTEAAQELAERIKGGERIGRVSLEARLAEIKGGVAATQEPAPKQPAPRAELADIAAVPGAAAEPAEDQPETDGPESALQDAQNDHEPTPRANPPTTVAQAVQQAMQEHQDGPKAATRQRPRLETAAGNDPMKTVVWRAEELFRESTGAIHRIRQLQADLAAAGVGEDDTDWRLWVAFVQLTCSGLVGIGQPRAGQMINRLIDELNSKSAIELLNALHPSRKPGVLPDDFRYDTDREIHPLAPNNWAL